MRPGCTQIFAGEVDYCYLQHYNLSEPKECRMDKHIKCCEIIFWEYIKCKSHWVLFIHSSDKLMFETELKHICLDFRLLDWFKLYEIFNQVFHILRLRCFVGLFLTERQYIVICLHNQKGERKHWIHTKSKSVQDSFQIGPFELWCLVLFVQIIWFRNF